MATIFGDFARHLLILSAICLGIGFLTFGKLLALISEDENRLVIFTLGFMFTILMGFILGYMIGPSLYFVVTEVPFIVGSMTGVGLLIHLLARETRGSS